MDRKPVSLGDVVVHVGEPPQGNPYRAPSLCGPERADALRHFFQGEDTTGLTFWHAPCSGGARRLESPPELDSAVLADLIARGQRAR